MLDKPFVELRMELWLLSHLLLRLALVMQPLATFFKQPLEGVHLGSFKAATTTQLLSGLWVLVLRRLRQLTQI